MHIDQYSFGRIIVNGRTYTSDVIILPEEVNDSWWRAEGHEVCIEDLDPVFEASPEILIVGTGASGLMKVSAEASELMDRRCDQVHVLKTPQAVEKYNELEKTTDRRVVAALHLTC
jgi:hypothetical protein